LIAAINSFWLAESMARSAAESALPSVSKPTLLLGFFLDEDICDEILGVGEGVILATI